MSAPLRGILALAWLLSLGCGAPTPQPPPGSAPRAPATEASLASKPAVPVRDSRIALAERAVDGDTLVLAGGERVRILGIDTPEMRDASPVLRDLALQARHALAALVEGRSVRLVAGPTAQDTYGRTLAHVEVEESSGAWVDVGRRLIDASLARVYPSRHSRVAAYVAAEAEAQDRGDGVWAPEARRAWGPRAEVVIHPGEARDHLDRIARVEGRLVAASRREAVLLLTLEGGGATLKVVSFGPALFPPELVESWMNREVAATGKLKLYEGLPELIVERPDQVEIPASETVLPHPR